MTAPERIPDFNEMYWFLHRLWISRHDETRSDDPHQKILCALSAMIGEAGQLRDEYYHHVDLMQKLMARHASVRILRAAYEPVKGLPLPKHLQDMPQPEWLTKHD